MLEQVQKAIVQIRKNFEKHLKRKLTSDEEMYMLQQFSRQVYPLKFNINVRIDEDDPSMVHIDILPSIEYIECTITLDKINKE